VASLEETPVKRGKRLKEKGRLWVCAQIGSLSGLDLWEQGGGVGAKELLLLGGVGGGGFVFFFFLFFVGVGFGCFFGVFLWVLVFLFPRTSGSLATLLTRGLVDARQCTKEKKEHRAIHTWETVSREDPFFG